MVTVERANGMARHCTEENVQMGNEKAPSWGKCRWQSQWGVCDQCADEAGTLHPLSVWAGILTALLIPAAC